MDSSWPSTIRAQLANRIDRLLKDADLRSRLGIAGQRRMRAEWTWDRVFVDVRPAVRRRGVGILSTEDPSQLPVSITIHFKACLFARVNPSPFGFVAAFCTLVSQGASG